MDTRRPIKNGSEIILYENLSKNGHVISYTIIDLIGKGANCLVYEATYNDSLNMAHKVRIKECFPYILNIRRDDNNDLIANAEHAMAYNKALVEYKEAYQRHVTVQEKLGVINSTANSRSILYGNNTYYIVVNYDEGTVYDQLEDKSIQQIFIRLKALAQVVRKYHEADFLHLDLKPANILILPETDEHVILLDFDTIVKISDIKCGRWGRISYSNGYAAPEQMQRRVSKLCPATDIYAIGAMAYTRIMGSVPDVMSRSMNASFDFAAKIQEYSDLPSKLFDTLQMFFRKTLASSPNRRYQSIAEMDDIFDKLITLSVPNQLFVKSNFVYSTNTFIGRKAELEEMDNVLASQQVVFLHGLGGIGKTEIAKRYAYLYQQNFDTVVFLHYEDSLVDTITNDHELMIVHFRREEDENVDSYFKRKLMKLSELVNENYLFIIDNFDVEMDDNLEILLSCPAKFIFTSRIDFSDWNYPQIDIVEMMDMDELLQLFSSYNHFDYSTADWEIIKEIIEIIDGHTMTVELIAKELRMSGKDPSILRDKLRSVTGVVESGCERVKHRKDKKLTAASVQLHLQILFDLAELNDLECIAIRNLSLFGNTRINTDLFNKWCDLGDDRAISHLVKLGWMQQDDRSNKIYLHQVILDLVYNYLQPTADNCYALVHSMVDYVVQPLERYTEKNQRRKLCEIFLQRIRGNNQSLLIFYINYCKNIYLCKDLLNKVLLYCNSENLANYVMLAECSMLLGKYYEKKLEDIFGDEADDSSKEKVDKILHWYAMAVQNGRKAHTTNSLNLIRFLVNVADTCMANVPFMSIEINDEDICRLYKFSENILVEAIDTFERLYKEQKIELDELIFIYRKIVDFYAVNDYCAPIKSEHFGDAQLVFFYKSKIKSLEASMPLQLDVLDIYSELASDAENNGDYELAIDYYQKALDAGESKEWTMMRLADIYEKTKAYNKAIIIWEKILEETLKSEYGNSGYEYYHLGRLYHFIGDDTNELNMLNMCIEVEQRYLHVEDNNSEILLIAKAFYERAKLSDLYGAYCQECFAFYKKYESILCDKEEMAVLQESYADYLRENGQIEQALQYYFLAADNIEKNNFVIANVKQQLLAIFMKIAVEATKYSLYEQHILAVYRIAHVYEADDDYLKAREFYVNAYKLTENHSALNLVITMRIIKALGDIYSHLEDYEKCYLYQSMCDYYIIAIEDSEESGADLTKIWCNAASEYRECNKYTDELRCYEQLFNLWKPNFSNDRNAFDIYISIVFEEMDCCTRLNNFAMRDKIFISFIDVFKDILRNATDNTYDTKWLGDRFHDVAEKIKAFWLDRTILYYFLYAYCCLNLENEFVDLKEAILLKYWDDEQLLTEECFYLMERGISIEGLDHIIDICENITDLCKMVPERTQLYKKSQSVIRQYRDCIFEFHN